ncbi:hypothetical protein HFO86_25665 [Rhizobium leguminosarum]|uniref:hypothetical protein n=1 Tax=Rhizobium leguminosarum TaxID=384 RepID=UPI001C9633D9|nr:hypothetical protein [Rhizobium leguminosarum]MBY5473584.1 hypothetical protein [Rhizobium leguminosarum]
MSTNRRKLFKVKTMEGFETQALAEDQRLRSYRVSYACWQLFGDGTREDLSAKNAESLKAINAVARIEFTRALIAELQSIRAKLEPVYFVTLISNKHAGPLPTVSSFDLGTYRKWVRKALDGLDFIGLADLGYYYRSPFLVDGDKPHGSWHCHLIVWGAPKSVVQGKKRCLDAIEDAFVPGASPFDYQIRSSEEVEEMLFYMAKGLVGEYSAFPIKHEVADKITGELLMVPSSRWRNQKRKIGPAALVRAINCIGEATLKDMCVANGGGKRLKRNAVRKARAKLAFLRSLHEKALARALSTF